jgi:hypothetical protein
LNLPKQTMMSATSKSAISKSGICPGAAGLLFCLAVLAPGGAAGQTTPPVAAPQAAAPTASSFQGSVVKGEVSAQAIGLSLDDAIQRGLNTNLGIILSGTQTATARAERLSQLQSLLPSIDFNARESVQQVDLPADDYRAVWLYGCAGFAELVSGGCGFAAELHGGAAQLCGGAVVGRGCARHGGADGGQCVPAGAGR